MSKLLNKRIEVLGKGRSNNHMHPDSKKRRSSFLVALLFTVGDVRRWVALERSMRKVVMLLLVVLTACASPYQREGFGGGYSETQLSENVFKVSFRGNGYTGGDRAADMALLRSAEVTLEHGFKYFAVVDEQSSSSYGTYTAPTTTNASVTGYGNSAYGTATTYGGQTFLIAKPRSTNLIACFNQKPEGFFVFEAEFVAKSLRDKFGVKQ